MKTVIKFCRLVTFCMTIILSLTAAAFAREPLEMHVLDVGQGQSVILVCDDHYMIVDGGGKGVSSFVVSYLKQLGAETIDLVAISHYEEDHMSGIIGVLSAFACDRLLLPSYAGSGELYQSLAVEAISNGCTILHPDVGFECILGETSVRVIGPQRTDHSSDNDLSLCFSVSFGDKAFLICGDAQQESELDMVSSGEDLNSDVYVVNHHGSNTSSMDVFLDAVSPRYAIISCGKDNGYGHPSMETLQRLQNHGISMFRTDQQGTVIAYTDGSDIWFNMEPTDNWAPGNGIITVTISDNEASESNATTRLPTGDDIGEGTEYTYVCNTNTKKFHDPGCDSVAQMKENNRLYTNLSREELLAEGYEPCGNCRP